MLRTSVGQLLVNDALPEDLRDYARILDKKGMQALLRDVAERHPEHYRDVSKKLSDVGRAVATESGGFSFGLHHLSKAKAGRKYQQQLRADLKQILDNDRLTDKQRHELIVRAAGRAQGPQMDEVLQESLAEGNPLAYQVLSGSRGNKMNLASLRGSDVLYADHRDEPIPVLIDRSYSEGLPPIQYWAGSYGARKGVLATKIATRDAGYLGKVTNQVAHRLIVTDQDDPRPDHGERGLPVDTEDPDNEGALLARDAGPYRRNTHLAPKILRHLKALGHDRILVRSPIVGGSPDGGVYARDVGVREYGTLPGRWSAVGQTAAQALNEPLSQGSLGAKHSGGVAGQEKAVGGFKYIEQLIQVPKQFKGRAAHAELDGRVDRVEEAPAGGQHVWIEGAQHYVPQGHALKVKTGDRVEAGDVLSEGAPDEATVVQHKGIGEGRRYFAYAMRQALADAGIRGHRRNTELLARGLINHVRITDEYGGHVPDDIVPYSALEHTYEPREGHQVVRPERALGHYLEKPVLHYTIGTKVRPSVLAELKHFGVKEVTAHRDPPPFEPHMVRGADSLQHDPDWLTRMYGSGLKGSLLDAVHRGLWSTELGTSFVPGLARSVDFGRIGLIRRPEAGKHPEEGAAMARKSSPSAALDLPERKREPRTVTSRLGAMFKLSLDEAASIRQARELLTKVGADGTHTGYTGSSTADAGGHTVNLGGQSGKPQPPEPAGQWSRGPLPVPARPSAPPPPVPNRSGGPTVLGQPGQPATTPGEVHPARQATGYGGYEPQAGLHQFGADPETLKRFVYGGGTPDDLDGGFGGSLGALLRFGTLLDQNAVATLTGGSPYARRNYGGHPGPAMAQGPYGQMPAGLSAPSRAEWDAGPAQPEPAEQGQAAAGGAPAGGGLVGLVKQLAPPLAAQGLVDMAYRRGSRALLGTPAPASVLNAGLDVANRRWGLPEILGGKGLGQPTTADDYAEAFTGLGQMRTGGTGGFGEPGDLTGRAVGRQTAALGLGGVNAAMNPVSSVQGLADLELGKLKARTGASTPGALYPADAAVDRTAFHPAARMRAEATGEPFEEALEKVLRLDAAEKARGKAQAEDQARQLEPGWFGRNVTRPALQGLSNATHSLTDPAPAPRPPGPAAAPPERGMTGEPRPPATAETKRWSALWDKYNREHLPAQPNE